MFLKSKNKIFQRSIIGLLIVSFFVFSFPGQTKAESIQDLLAKIAALQAELIRLQGQLPGGTTFNRNLTIGSRGTDVASLQTWLISKNFLAIPAGTARGYFGVLTRNAVASWQRSERISPAAGYFGPISRARLNAILRDTSEPLPPPPNNLGINVVCRPNATQVNPVALVTWQAEVIGTSVSYTYSWQGTDALTGGGLTAQKIYSTNGVKTATVTVNGQHAFPCGTSVTVGEQQGNQINASSFSVDLYRDQSLVKYTDRAIAWHTIGGRSTYMPYRLAWLENDPLPESYWTSPQFTAELYWTLNRGFQRIFLHNPFRQSPTSTEGGMQFDQYLEAQVTTPWLTNRFVEIFKPVVESGVEVIAYVGSPDPYEPGGHNGDCEQQALMEKPDLWWARAWSALQPFLDAGMSIGLDASVVTDANSYTYQLAEALRARGVRVYVESVPEVRNPHWGVYPFIMANSQWWWLVPGMPQSMPLSQLSGEIFRFVNYPQNQQSEIDQILLEGYTASADWSIPLREAIIDSIDSTVTIDLPSRSNSPAGSSFNIQSNPTRGQLTPIGGTGSGRYTYTANSGSSGADTFVYVANRNSDTSAPATVTVNIHNEMPFVKAEQLMTAARQAGGGNSKVVAIWPLFEKEIQNLNISSMISPDMVPKRVITFQVGGSPVSYIAGYNKNTFAPMAVSAGRALIAQAEEPSNTQYAAAIESSFGERLVQFFKDLWNGLVEFWESIL